LGKLKNSDFLLKEKNRDFWKKRKKCIFQSYIFAHKAAIFEAIAKNNTAITRGDSAIFKKAHKLWVGPRTAIFY